MIIMLQHPHQVKRGSFLCIYLYDSTHEIWSTSHSFNFGATRQESEPGKWSRFKTVLCLLRGIHSIQPAIIFIRNPLTGKLALWPGIYDHLYIYGDRLTLIVYGLIKAHTCPLCGLLWSQFDLLRPLRLWFYFIVPRSNKSLVINRCNLWR